MFCHYCNIGHLTSIAFSHSLLSVAWSTGVQLVFFVFAPELVSYYIIFDKCRKDDCICIE